MEWHLIKEQRPDFKAQFIPSEARRLPPYVFYPPSLKLGVEFL